MDGSSLRIARPSVDLPETGFSDEPQGLAAFDGQRHAIDRRESALRRDESAAKGIADGEVPRLDQDRALG